MKLYKMEFPLPCDILGCENTDATLIIHTDEDTDHAVCPLCVRTMSDMNSDNAKFFAQVAALGQVQKGVTK